MANDIGTMNDPKLQTILSFVSDVLELDPESIMKQYVKGSIPFVRQQRSRHGSFANPANNTEVQRFRIFAPLGRSFIGPYADIHVGDEISTLDSLLTKAKMRFVVEFGWGMIRLPRDLRRKIMRQFTYIDSLMRENEGIPLLHQLTSETQIVKEYQIRPFVSPRIDDAKIVQMSLMTDNFFIKMAGSVATTGPVLHGEPLDDEDSEDIEDPIDSKAESKTESNSVTDVKIDRNTLPFWPDPRGKFVDFAMLNEFAINMKIDARDSDGNKVHPRDYESVFPKGTWVDADIFCCGWDYTQQTKPQMTYQCKLLSIRAVAPPLPAEYYLPSPVIQRPPSTPKKRKSDDAGLSVPSPRMITPSPSPRTSTLRPLSTLPVPLSPSPAGKSNAGSDMDCETP